MNLLKKCFVLSTFLTLIIGCKPVKSTSNGTPNTNNDTTMLIGKTWKLVGITFHEKDQYIVRPEEEKGLTVTFQEAGQLSYKLSANSCFGKYEANGENLTITLGGCTKMCCDSNFSNDFQSILSTAKSYKIHGGDHLDINGTEKILKLEKMED